MRKKDEEYENNNSNGAGVFVGLLLGSLIGAVAMFLLAPQSGKKTRGQIQQKSIELRGRANDVLTDTMKQVRMEGMKFTKSGRKKAKELYVQGQDLVMEQLDHVVDAAKAGKKAIHDA